MENTNELPKELSDAIADGLIMGVVSFGKKHHHQLTDAQFGEYIKSLSSGLNPEPGSLEVIWPLATSFKDAWLAALSEISPIIQSLWQKGGDDGRSNAGALARTIAFGEVVRFLDANVDEATNELKRISELKQP